MDFPKVINYQNTDQDVQVKTLQEFEKEYILKIIKKCNGRIFGETGCKNYWDCLRQRLFQNAETRNRKKTLFQGI
jgi:hypothetical protein